MTKPKKSIDYRKYYINYLVRVIEDNLKKIEQINTMPENLIEDQMYKDDIFINYKEDN